MHLISPAPFPQEFLKELIFVYVPLKVYSFFCSTTKLWNEIDLAIRLCDTIGSFKRMLANYYISDYFLPFDYLLDRYCSIIHSRLRPDACALFHYHFKTGVLSSTICSCGVDKETKSQFFYFVLNMLVQEKNCSLLVLVFFSSDEWSRYSDSQEVIFFLLGSSHSSPEENVELFSYAQQFIKESKRFSFLSFKGIIYS